MIDATTQQLAVMPGPAGTSGLIDAGSIRALVGYMEQRDGISDVLGCGCTASVECGYHREQSQRTAIRPTPAVSRG